MKFGDLLYFMNSGISAASAFIASREFVDGRNLTGLLGAYISFVYTTYTLDALKTIKMQRKLDQIGGDLADIRIETSYLESRINQASSDQEQKKELALKRARLLRRVDSIQRRLS